MAQKIVVVAFFMAVFMQAANSQCLNRFLPLASPNCGCSNILPVDLPNQIIYNNAPALDTTYNPLAGQTTIIQDSTVANNLANALQLLVVSNLLSGALPLNQEPLVDFTSYAAPLAPLAPLATPVAAAPISVPSCGCARPSCNCGLNGYNFFY